MSGWLIAVLVVVVLFVYLEIKNRRERSLYQQVERENAELLEGRFQSNPVLRRRFMRALVRYCCSDGFDEVAFELAKNATRIAEEPEDLAGCALLLAFNLEAKDDYAGAVMTYDKVLKVEPDGMVALSRRAAALGMLRDEACVEAFEDVIRRKPDSAVYRNNYGSALLRLGRFEEAEVQLKKAAELKPSLASAQELLAMAYAAMENNEASEKALQAAVSLGSDETKVRDAIRQFKEGSEA